MLSPLRRSFSAAAANGQPFSQVRMQPRSRSSPIPTKKLVISAPNLPSGDAREKALSTVSQSLGEDDKFRSGYISFNRLM